MKREREWPKAPEAPVCSKEQSAKTPAGKVEKTIIWREQERCPACSAVDSLVTYNSKQLISYRRRLRQCRRCGWVVEERSAIS